MKKRLALCLAAALLFLCACAETELPAPSEPEKTEPSSESVQPAELPEDCKIYSDLAAEEIVCAFDSGRGGEGSYRSGMPESLYAVRGGELVEINVSGMTSDALSVAEAFGENARQISGEGATCLSWDGNRYICFTIRVEDTELPALTAPTGGILALEVHGDCRMDPGDAEWAALSGFDCVILSGDGTLTLNGGLKTGGTALPALILNGVALAADNTDTATTGDGLAFLQFSGGLRTELLRVQGDLCVTGGELSAGQIFESTVKNAVFRGGTALIGACDASAVETLILSGGTAAFFEPLPAGCAVQAGAGLLCAPGLSGVSSSDGCTVLDADADGTVFYGHLELNEEQLAAQDAAGITQTRFLPVQAAQNLWLSGCLRLENAEVERLTPWSGLWLDAEGESTVGGAEKLGAPALLITGGGKLTLRGGVGLFGYERYHRACLVLRDAEVQITDATEDAIYMGNATGENDLLLVQSGALRADGGVWLDHAEVHVENGTVQIGGSFGMGGGSLTVDGGEVTLHELFLESGELVINGGIVTLDSCCIQNGNITLNGGTLVLPNGRESVVTENGSLSVNGGEIKE